MVRMISGVCALGLLVGSYFVCPQALQARIAEAMSPSEQTLAEVRAGIDTLAGRFTGPGELHPDA